MNSLAFPSNLMWMLNIIIKDRYISIDSYDAIFCLASVVKRKWQTRICKYATMAKTSTHSKLQCVHKMELKNKNQISDIKKHTNLLKYFTQQLHQLLSFPWPFNLRLWIIYRIIMKVTETSLIGRMIISGHWMTRSSTWSSSFHF